jgi:hypothetical protein
LKTWWPGTELNGRRPSGLFSVNLSYCLYRLYVWEGTINGATNWHHNGTTKLTPALTFRQRVQYFLDAARDQWTHYDTGLRLSQSPIATLYRFPLGALQLDGYSKFGAA